MSTAPSNNSDQDVPVSDTTATVSQWYSVLEKTRHTPVGELTYGDKAQETLRPFRQLRHLMRAQYAVATETAGYREELEGEEREAFRSDLSELILDLFGAVDAAEGGRTVTALSVGTNALRDDVAQFREAFDDLIAGYLTTGQYHESHEAFVTMSLLFEQWLKAMADSTTVQHDILDDAVSSNTRIMANLLRGLSYYAQQIAKLPESSYGNVADVLATKADPHEFGQLVTALLVIHNRVHAAGPATQVLLHRAFWSGVNPSVLREAIVNTADTVSQGLSSNPPMRKALRSGLRRATWIFTRELVLPRWLAARV